MNWTTLISAPILALLLAWLYRFFVAGLSILAGLLGCTVQSSVKLGGITSIDVKPRQADRTDKAPEVLPEKPPE